LAISEADYEEREEVLEICTQRVEDLDNEAQELFEANLYPNLDELVAHVEKSGLEKKSFGVSGVSGILDMILGDYVDMTIFRAVRETSKLPLVLSLCLFKQ
jgi:hypothetical protein